VTETLPISASLLDRAHENHYEAWRLLARAARDGAIEEGCGLLCTTEGVSLSFLNQAFITRPVRDPAALIARAERFYAARGFPWLLRAVAPPPPDLERAATAAGLVRSEPLPGMVLAPLTGEARPAPRLEVRVVEDMASLRVFNEVSDAGFGMPPEVTEALTTPALLEPPDVAMYIGYVDGRPAATSMRVTSHRIAGVYTVATLEEFRGRGIGEAMTWRAALGGLAEGCVAASLQASRMGFPIYARMGFRHVVDYATWERA
jgi:GNAT superfamily N-acetyltransferase